MLKDFKNDNQSNGGIVRFSRLVMCISRLTIFNSYYFSFYFKKKTSGVFIMEIKKQTWKFYLNHLLPVKIIIQNYQSTKENLSLLKFFLM